jgi:RimJ/RimL family protein N-acetyltransferase
VNETHIKDLTFSRYGGFDQLSNDVRAQLTAKDPASDTRQLLRKFADGRELWVGDILGTVAVVCWSRSRLRRIDYFLPLEPTDSTILSCYTVSGFRGRGFYPALLQHMVNTFISQGQTRIFIDCLTSNFPSIRGIEKAGFRKTGTSWRIVFREKAWYFFNRCQM